MSRKPNEFLANDATGTTHPAHYAKRDGTRLNSTAALKTYFDGLLGAVGIPLKNIGNALDNTSEQASILYDRFAFQTARVKHGRDERR
ncbi:MAG: hypothetical protein EBU46_12885 [Nitrosomonadaceae bacterium]|jgi:hypothetical protein|nr:hypothetical protein [Nitrosomonadaceae bacterium]